MAGCAYMQNWNAQKPAYRTSSTMPCQRESLPRASAGTVSSSITSSIRGISTTREALYPAMVFSWGTWKGDRVVDRPLTSTRLNRFAPTMLPRDRALWP